MKKSLLASLIFTFLFLCPPYPRAETLKEASGIARAGDFLLIVGDDLPGLYFRFDIRNERGPFMAIEDEGLETVRLKGAGLGLDLEAIDVLSDGRVALLSERLRSLVGEDGLIVEYGGPLGEFGNRGLEGLAVKTINKDTSRIAVLWEGGYPEPHALQKQFQKIADGLRLKPLVLVHDLEAGAKDMEVKVEYALTVVELDVPDPGGDQWFRAPDLVWCGLEDDREGFIVLLSSRSRPGRGKMRFAHTWLMRFDIHGKALEEYIDLKKVLPPGLRNANWEGMDWFEEGKSLVLIHDEPPKGPPTAVIVDVPEGWCVFN